MFKGRWVELVEGENNRLSMTRLLCFLSFFPASYVVIITAEADTLGWYLAAYVAGYIGGKTADVMGRPQSLKDTNVTINQPEKVSVNK